MKRAYIAGVLSLLLLNGCVQQPIETTSGNLATQPIETTSETLATQAGEPSVTTQTEPVTQPPETVPATTQTQPVETLPPQPDQFVRVRDYIPDLVVELRYATAENFTGQVIYTFSDAYLRYGTVCKLMQVQAELETLGLGLKLWDGFRPPSAQHKLWQICPDPTYVSDPNKGYSNHSRGDTVDITLVTQSGEELEMPTGFDDFSSMADRNYSDCTDAAAKNARLLEQLMEKYGFSGYFGEWWHYADTDDYPVEFEFLSE